MPDTTLNIGKIPTRLPDGYQAISIREDQRSALIKIMVIVKSEPDSIKGHFLVLRESLDAKVLLGCIMDVDERVHAWVELWYENPLSVRSPGSGPNRNLSNSTRARRWEKMLKSVGSFCAYPTISTKWELEYPEPTFLNLGTNTPVHPKDEETGIQWTLCREDQLLKELDLPSYSNSHFRYLYLKDLGKSSPFVPMTPSAPTLNPANKIEEVTNGNKDLIPLNPSGERFLVMNYLPLGLEDYIEILNGGAWEGIWHGQSFFVPTGLPSKYSQKKGDGAIQGQLFLERNGISSRVLEVFHLKLRVLADVLKSVRHVEKQTQHPFFNLSLGSFRIDVSNSGEGLPHLWSTKTILTRPGNAISVRIEGANIRFFLDNDASNPSIYMPGISQKTTRGEGTIRIRQIFAEKDNQTVIEGTLLAESTIFATENDYLWIQLNLICGIVELYGHICEDTTLSKGEYRFRTIARQFNENESHSLKEAVGISIQKARFEVLPLVSSPRDLYSLGVLAVRLLLVDNDSTLAIALDEILGLAKEIENSYDESITLSKRIEKLFNTEARWEQSLGPHHLVYDELSVEDGFHCIPAPLWFEMLATILQMFPGNGPDSGCKNFGHASDGAIHRIFERPSETIDDLIRRTRSLIIPDWEVNNEVREVIHQHSSV